MWLKVLYVYIVYHIQSLIGSNLYNLKKNYVGDLFGL